MSTIPIQASKYKSEGTSAVEEALGRAKEFAKRADNYLTTDSGEDRASMLRESMELTKILAKMRRVGR